ncbi:hypothetical protein BY458DRAFT_514828 [Sporodiniella umbellata]|nr:hypothetical protein BY458DRAFT_514828 [Sporodiniella umbellata]
MTDFQMLLSDLQVAHSLTNCPLETPWVITSNHNTQEIVMVTDELLALLGFSLKEVHAKPVTQWIKLLSRMTIIPECHIVNAEGDPLRFAFTIHHCNQEDYWILSPSSGQDQLIVPSMLGVNLLGGIEKAHNFHFKQQTLTGYPIMAFVYNDDLPALFRYLCIALRYHETEPMFLRWSRSHSVYTNPHGEYDWMYFMFVTSTYDPSQVLAIARSLHCQCVEIQIRKSFYHSLQEYFSLGTEQIKKCYTMGIALARTCAETSKEAKEECKAYIKTSKAYVWEYGQYIMSYLLDQNNLLGYYINNNRLTKQSLNLLHFINCVFEE